MKYLSIFFLSLFVLAGCSDEETQVALSNDEIILLLGNSIASDAGLSSHFSEVDQVMSDVQSGSLPGGRVAGFCDMTDEFTISYESGPNDPFVMSFNYDWAIATSCNKNGVLETFGYELDFDGSVDTEDVAQSFFGVAELTVSGVSSEVHTYVGSYDVSVTINVKSGYELNGTHRTQQTMNGLKVYPNTGLILGTVILNGQGTTDKGSYKFTAECTFTEDRTVTVLLNGSTYVLDATTGTVIS